ncbi:DUF262 domain-containing protein [Pengzhenrongella frigida]|uniref:DUF262 domain-containing protein n=1 Tax=Pengzhenrongella frigida TaxID=1259133 RepID=A0A4Q5MV62_9MICO|nr:DUF262 domain-containing protein [Cellulomonas sp. HLT2-17]RYV49339.1 DUF262 domain-containing protein [Cellulomonas sp. HLT2-17]
MSSSTFEVPPYQREYAWNEEEVGEFWSDLQGALDEGSYFLGLIILTEEDERKHVVDGQQRILTMTLLAAALYHEAVRAGRKALADRVQADFLRSIDYSTDETNPRVILSDRRDNAALQALLISPETGQDLPVALDGISDKLSLAYEYIAKKLREDLSPDPFRRLGIWADFLTNQVHLAVFVHPDRASAYRVFEVVNTRGRELTTADLLKNFVLSQTAIHARDERYEQWKKISNQFRSAGSGAFVQYIRHVVTLTAGHIAPRDLFDYLAERRKSSDSMRRSPSATGELQRRAPSPDELMGSLERELPLYLQMIDPTLDGPGDPSWVQVFSALSELSVISVRPLLLAISRTDEPEAGMQAVLRLVLRRIVVGNLGTGNVERRLGEAARKVVQDGSWVGALDELADLNPPPSEFVEQLRKRSLNKGTLTFVRRSVVQRTTTPEARGTLHLVRPRQAAEWSGFPETDFSYWGSTLGNTFLASVERRPKGAGTWDGFKQNLLPLALENEHVELFQDVIEWNSRVVEEFGTRLGESAREIWF